MNFQDIIKYKENGEIPDELPVLIKSLLYDASGDWERAHRIAQDMNSKEGAWVHAYLHRKEGDQWNAKYWYSRCGKTYPDSSLNEEWQEIARALIS